MFEPGGFSKGQASPWAESYTGIQKYLSQQRAVVRKLCYGAAGITAVCLFLSFYSGAQAGPHADHLAKFPASNSTEGRGFSRFWPWRLWNYDDELDPLIEDDPGAGYWDDARGVWVSREDQAGGYWDEDAGQWVDTRGGYWDGDADRWVSTNAGEGLPEGDLPRGGLDQAERRAEEEAMDPTEAADLAMASAEAEAVEQQGQGGGSAAAAEERREEAAEAQELREEAAERREEAVAEAEERREVAAEERREEVAEEKREEAAEERREEAAEERREEAAEERMEAAESGEWREEAAEERREEVAASHEGGHEGGQQGEFHQELLGESEQRGLAREGQEDGPAEEEFLEEEQHSTARLDAMRSAASAIDEAHPHAAYHPGDAAEPEAGSEAKLELEGEGEGLEEILENRHSRRVLAAPRKAAAATKAMSDADKLDAVRARIRLLRDALVQASRQKGKVRLTSVQAAKLREAIAVLREQLIAVTDRLAAQPEGADDDSANPEEEYEEYAWEEEERPPPPPKRPAPRKGAAKKGGRGSKAGRKLVGDTVALKALWEERIKDAIVI